MEFAEAVQDFTKALKLKPNMAVAFYNRGLIHYRLGGVILTVLFYLYLSNVLKQ